MRLLAVLELLETYSSISGSEMARKLEVDPRTIRRYIVTLQDMGIALITEKGPAGSYRLKRGSRLPPLIFNDSEASAITVGLQAIRQMNFPFDAAAIEGALAKIERLLPEKLLEYVNDLKDLVKIHSSSYSSAAHILRGDFVRLLDRAILKRRRAILAYSSKSGFTTLREVDVYGLVLVGDYWYAPAYCHLRKELRIFRMDRVLSIEVTETNFERPQDFDSLRSVLDALEHLQKTFEVEVILNMTMEKARGLFNSEFHLLEPREEGVLYKLTTSRLDWVAFGLLATNVPLTIIKPPELCDVFQGISQRAARIVKGT